MKKAGMEIPFRYLLWKKIQWISKPGSAYDGLITTKEVQQPTISDHDLHLKKTQTLRDLAKNASFRLDEPMIRSHAKNHLYKL